MKKQRRQAYQAIKIVCQNNHGWISILLTYIGVSRQAYNKFHNRTETALDRRDRVLKKHVKRIYLEHNKGIGAGKILTHLKKEVEINPEPTIKQVKRIMRELRISCIVRKKKKNRKDLNERYIQDNVLNRQFTAEKPNQIWLSDSTQLEYGKGTTHKVRLNGILDTYGNYLIGYKITETETAQAETDMFQETFDRIGNVHPLVHTDRGSAYLSYKFNDLLARHQVTRSMSRPGTPYDNSPMEHWWGDFKERWMNLHPIPESLESLKVLVEQGINYFNKRDRSDKWKGSTPEEYWNEAFN